MPRFVNSNKTEIERAYYYASNDVYISASQTPINSDGRQLSWTTIKARWTGNQPYLESSDILTPCLSYLGIQFTNQELEVLANYHNDEISIEDNLKTKLKYFSDVNTTICKRGNEWLIFKRPSNHHINPFRIVKQNTEIILKNEIISIPELNEATFRRQEFNDTWITESNLVITPINVTKGDLINKNIDNIMFHKISKQSLQLMKDDALSIYKLEEKLRIQQDITDKLTRTVHQLLNHLHEIPSSNTHSQQQIVGDLIANYQCNNVTKYTPIWTRKIQNQCYQTIPIILDDQKDEPTSKCIWKAQLPSFLTQLASYIHKNKTIQFNGDIVDLHKETLMDIWIYLIRKTNKSNLIEYNDFEHGQILVLEYLLDHNITWQCPFHVNPEKIKFVDPRSRKITTDPQKTDCNQQTPIFVKHHKNYYLLSEAGITLAEAKIIINNNVQLTEEITTAKVSQLLDTQWSERLAPMTIHNTLDQATIQQRMVAYDLNEILAREELSMQETQDIIEIKRRFALLQLNEQLDWHQAMNAIIQINSTLDNYMTNTTSQISILNEEITSFNITLQRLSKNQVDLKRRLQLINVTLIQEVKTLKDEIVNITNTIDFIKTRITQLQKNQDDLQNQLTLLKVDVTTNTMELQRLQSNVTIIKTKIKTLQIQQKISTEKIAIHQQNIDTIQVKQKMMKKPHHF